MILRDYQQRIKVSVLKEWETVCSTLVVAPTGTGKTVLFASIIEAMQPKRAMVVAHREELIFQARDKIQRCTGLECGIEMADQYVNGSLFGDLPVVVSTIQTQNSGHGDRKRMSRFQPQDFGILCLDECHLSTGKSFQNLINYYKQHNPNIKILGVTATPRRHDQESLSQIFDTCPDEQQYHILDAISDGWLVDVDQQFVKTTIDWSGIRTTAGDLNGADLAAVMESEDSMQQVAGATIDIVGGRRTLIFTASVKQAEVLCNILNRHKSGMAEWVCGATNKDKRRELLARYDAGDIQVMCNCNCLSEGYDSPGVEVVVLASPTKSKLLYQQRLGRCLRPLPGVVDGPETPELRRAAIAASSKPVATAIDFAGNSGRHKLICVADVLGGRVSDDALERAVKRAQKLGKPVRMSQVLDEEEDNVRTEAEERRQREEARKAKLVAKVAFTKKSINPFDVFEIEPVRERGWDNGKTLSEKQRGMLLKQGIDPSTLSYGQARQVIAQMFDRWNKKLATVKQSDLLQKHGYSTKDMSMDTASKIITALKANGWRRPAEDLNPVMADTSEPPF